jgi:energy-coupling factor transporter ATP-binding protein EcfA2
MSPQPPVPVMPAVFMSERFRKSYVSASPSLQRQIEGAARNAVAGILSDVAAFKRRVDRVARLKESVLELKVTGGERLLAQATSARLDLLAVGGHELTARYEVNMLVHDRQTLHPASSRLVPGEHERVNLILESITRSGSVWANELTPEWTYYLAESQYEPLFEIATASTRALQPPAGEWFLMTGGPGTGKTTILMALLLLLANEGVSVAIAASERVAEYMDAAIPSVRMADHLCERMSAPEVDVLLVDDPRSVAEVSWSMSVAAMYQTVVTAFDPGQLSDDLSDAQYASWLRNGANEVQLSECYRQKENVGRATLRLMNAIRTSAPFLDRRKIRAFHEGHALMGKLSCELSFPNPDGYVKVYRPADFGDLQGELTRIRSAPTWTHWRHLLAVIDERVNLAARWTAALSDADAQVIVKEDVESIKGLEYQHALLIFPESVYDEIEEGFRGAGRGGYNARKLLRIPFSRAKDSVAVFVIPNL